MPSEGVISHVSGKARRSKQLRGEKTQAWIMSYIFLEICAIKQELLAEIRAMSEGPLSQGTVCYHEVIGNSAISQTHFTFLFML